MKNGALDSYLVVEDEQRSVLDSNDDDPNLPVNTTLDSWLRFTVPEDGLYRVVATCYTGFRRFGMLAATRGDAFQCWLQAQGNPFPRHVASVHVLEPAR